MTAMALPQRARSPLPLLNPSSSASSNRRVKLRNAQYSRNSAPGHDVRFAAAQGYPRLFAPRPGLSCCVLCPGRPVGQKSQSARALGGFEPWPDFTRDGSPGSACGATALCKRPDPRRALWPAVMRTALPGRTHGRTDHTLRREDSPCQPGAVHTWHLAVVPDRPFRSASRGKADAVTKATYRS